MQKMSVLPYITCKNTIIMCRVEFEVVIMCECVYTPIYTHTKNTDLENILICVTIIRVLKYRLFEFSEFEGISFIVSVSVIQI